MYGLGWWAGDGAETGCVCTGCGCGCALCAYHELDDLGLGEVPVQGRPFRDVFTPLISRDVPLPPDLDVQGVKGVVAVHDRVDAEVEDDRNLQQAGRVAGRVGREKPRELLLLALLALQFVFLTH